MGCGTSTLSTYPGKDFFEAFNASRQADPPEMPLTPEGLQAQQICHDQYQHLEQRIRELMQNSGTALSSENKSADLKTIAKIICNSDYIQKSVSSVLQPMRTFEGKWCKFDYPDNGQWRIGYDSKSGIVSVLSNHKIVAVSIAISMGPMRSQVDSEGYANMYQTNIQERVFNRLPNMINGQLVMRASHTAKEPMELPDNNTFYKWTQVMESRMTTKQLEVHGMRNESLSVPRKTHYYGFNISCVCPNVEMFDAMEGLFEHILNTLHFADADTCEKHLGAYWDKMGR